MELEGIFIRYMHLTLDHVYSYGAQIFFVAFLFSMTVFRREMSCNSVLREESESEVKVLQTKHRSPSMEKKYQRSKSLWNQSKSKSCPLAKLPDEVQIKCLSYLHPRDILQFSCTDRQGHEMIHRDEGDPLSISSLLWYQIFVRDYAWILTQWKYGISAVLRSRATALRCPPMVASLLEKNSGIGSNANRIHMSIATSKTTSKSITTTMPPQHPAAAVAMKDFYLKFAQTWMEYCIAGRTQNPTLVGIHGHVFDMTSFLEDHPGSPETIIMQGGGKNTTNFFESVGHSSIARNLALNRLVEVVDLSCCRGDNSVTCGLKDMTSTNARNSNRNSARTDDIDGILPWKRSKTRVPGTLLQLRGRLEKERRVMKEEARRTVSKEMARRGRVDIVGDINVYFDPICYCWKGWYIDLEFQPVFIQNISAKD